MIYKQRIPWKLPILICLFIAIISCEESITNYEIKRDYIPIPMQNVYWKVREEVMYYETNMYTLISQYSFEGDSIIGNFEYGKLIRLKRYEIVSENDTVYDYRKELAGLIRQDTVNKRVYMYNNYGWDDLLYDYNLNVGDTLPYNLITNGNAITKDIIVTVRKIDTLEINENSHRRFWLKGKYVSDQFALIEGIGASNGLINGAWQYVQQNVLLCFMKDGEFQYSAHPTLTDCEIFRY